MPRREGSGHDPATYPTTARRFITVLSPHF